MIEDWVINEQIHFRLTSATRTHASQEFNHGLVFSSNPLQDDQIFEVRRDLILLCIYIFSYNLFLSQWEALSISWNYIIGTIR